jgi:deltex-like protein
MTPHQRDKRAGVATAPPLTRSLTRSLTGEDTKDKKPNAAATSDLPKPPPAFGATAATAHGFGSGVAVAPSLFSAGAAFPVGFAVPLAIASPSGLVKRRARKPSRLPRSKTPGDPTAASTPTNLKHPPSAFAAAPPTASPSGLVRRRKPAGRSRSKTPSTPTNLKQPPFVRRRKPAPTNLKQPPSAFAAAAVPIASPSGLVRRRIVRAKRPSPGLKLPPAAFSAAAAAVFPTAPTIASPSGLVKRKRAKKAMDGEVEGVFHKLGGLTIVIDSNDDDGTTKPFPAKRVKAGDSDQTSSIVWSEIQQQNLDRDLARTLATKYEEEAKIPKADSQVEAARMIKTPTGKAWKFVEGVLKIHARMIGSTQDPAAAAFIQPVAVDDIVALTERLLQHQEIFYEASKPFQVDLGYHYTQPENLQKIQAGGLLTKQERAEQKVEAKYNGSVWGDGVYTADHAYSFMSQLQRFGTLGLLVVRLRGQEGFPAVVRDGLTMMPAGPLPGAECDSVIAPSIVVLRQSSQCVAVLSYDATKINKENRQVCPMYNLLNLFHVEMQGLIDELLNRLPAQAAKPNAMTASKPPPIVGAPPAQLGAIIYNMQTHVGGSSFSSLPLETYASMAFSSADCPICFAGMSGVPITRLNSCGHELHVQCLQLCLAQKPQCPICRHPVAGTPFGKMPSGSMIVRLLPTSTCVGHSTGTLQIAYTFPKGVQQPVHPRPGSPYVGTTRVAYLPESSEGRRLLSRLQEAFRHGLCFAVGTSLTTGQQNAITWVSIPHKTKISGGVTHHGFPDPLYFKNCHAALDALHVKPASS